MRGGRDNDPDFFSRMKPDGVWASLFRKRFQIAAARLGINEREGLGLDCGQFRKPEVGGQLRLL